MSGKKIGILGGSFNPIHRGHIELAKTAKRELLLDGVLIIPDKIPPHKSAREMIPEEHRINMCRLAAEKEGFDVSDIELKMEGASFTYRTLERLRDIDPTAEYVLICGADMFNTLLEWKNPHRIFELCTVCGVYRAGENFELMQKMRDRYLSTGARACVINADIPDISSTEVRRRLKAGEDVSDLLDIGVYNYIKVNNLYGE